MPPHTCTRTQVLDRVRLVARALGVVFISASSEGHTSHTRAPTRFLGRASHVIILACSYISWAPSSISGGSDMSSINLMVVIGEPSGWEFLRHQDTRR